MITYKRMGLVMGLAMILSGGVAMARDYRPPAQTCGTN